MKTTIHCDERITNIRHTIYVKLFWGIIIANERKRSISGTFSVL